MRGIRKRTKRGGFNLHARPNFHEHIRPRFAGQPMRYLELGVFYGKSAIWMFRNILTHPEARADLVDPWMGDDKWYGKPKKQNTQARMDAVCETARRNLWRYRRRCTIHRMTSAAFFENCNNLYDLIYIDGEHSHDAALLDGQNAMRHIKSDGVIIFDDMELKGIIQAANEWHSEFDGQHTLFYETPRQRAYIITHPTR